MDGTKVYEELLNQKLIYLIYAYAGAPIASFYHTSNNFAIGPQGIGWRVGRKDGRYITCCFYFLLCCFC